MPPASLIGPLGAHVRPPPADAWTFPRPTRAQAAATPRREVLPIPTPVRRQGIGRCTADAFGRCVEILTGTGMETSVVGAYYFFRLDSGLPVNEDSGAYPEACIQSLKARGIGSISTWSNDEARYLERPDGPYQAQAKDHRVLASYRALRVAEMRAALASGFPIAIAAELRESFGEVGRDGLWRAPDGPVLGGHMMTVYGYDDDLEGGEGYGAGCFHVLNSWGEWGGDVLESTSYVPSWPDLTRGAFRLPYEAVEDEPFLYDSIVVSLFDVEAGR